MYTCNNFRIEELVPKEVFENEGESRKHLLWLIFDRDLLFIADMLRNRYGPMTCNDWLWGGSRNMSGFRPYDESVGSSLSQHKFGRALDLIPKKVHPDEIREDIINQKFGFMKGIQAIEMGISWLHFDTRNNSSGKLLRFHP